MAHSSDRSCVPTFSICKHALFVDLARASVAERSGMRNLAANLTLALNMPCLGDAELQHGAVPAIHSSR